MKPSPATVLLLSFRPARPIGTVLFIEVSDAIEMSPILSGAEK